MAAATSGDMKNQEVMEEEQPQTAEDEEEGRRGAQAGEEEVPWKTLKFSGGFLVRKSWGV